MISRRRIHPDFTSEEDILRMVPDPAARAILERKLRRWRGLDEPKPWPKHPDNDR